MPTVNRVFLGLEQPPIQSAANWLVDSSTQKSSIDLSGLIVVVPGTRPAQRLLQLLVAKADLQKRVLTPPTITTVGDLPEFLYDVERPFASELAMQTAWCQALQQTPTREIQHIVGGAKKQSLDDWQPLARIISALHRRLANDVWSFSSVAREIKKLEGSRETKRWESLESIQGRYYDLLTDVGLWDRQAARNVVAKDVPGRPSMCRTDRHIVMLGTADLNRSVRMMLAQIQSSVTALIAAPADLADRFDSLGSLITQEWLQVPIKIDDDHICIADQPEDQAFAAAQYISSLGNEFSSDQISIGCPDASVIPQIERSLNALGLLHRNLVGRPLSETGPVRMLVVAREYLDRQSYRTFAALVRHPDVFLWLNESLAQVGWLGDLDKFQQTSLPDRIGIKDTKPFGDPEQLGKRFVAGDESGQKRAERAAQSARRLNHIHAALAKLFIPLMGEPQPIAHWTRPWSDVLLSIYGFRLMDKNNTADRQTIKACQRIYEALGDEQQVPDAWEIRETSAQALELALEAVSDATIAPLPIPEAVEIAGWLDLPLDDAPVMVVTGMNDEHVPTSENGHLFLPNSLCEKLGILDNDRRYARDAYALTVIYQSRDKVLLILGRRNSEGEPGKPSRLLFADDPMTSARRAKAFFNYSGKSDARFWLADPANALRHQSLQIPEPICSQPPTSLTVTSFREYIKCPYRFYLSKILKLETVDDDWRELDGGAFGTLVHNVLEDFGLSDLRDATKPGAISELLNDRLSVWTARLYPGSRLPAVRIQVAQLRRRLERFAVIQSERAQDGWRIVSVEDMHEHELMVDGTPFTIRGMIDRIDVRDAGGGEVAIWDYKSSDKGEDPRAKHFSKNKGWIDLQLPLYRHLAKEIPELRGCDLSNPSLGFVVLPKQIDKIDFVSTRWSNRELEDADGKAFEIIRKIRRGVFGPPKMTPPEYSESFAGICQDNVFEKSTIQWTSGSEVAQ